LDAVGIPTLEYLLGRHSDPVALPNLARLGLGDLLASPHRDRLGCGDPTSCAVPLMQGSADADSVIGHREMCGAIDLRSFPLFFDGFPLEYVRELASATGREYFYNEMAGGLDAIERNADEHERTGRLILYASKCDPVMQIAMNEDIVPVAEQHAIVEAAFGLAWQMDVRVTRVISRPYVRTSSGGFRRTASRHDVVLPAAGTSLVDVLRRRGVRAVSVGKPSDLVGVPFDETVKLTDPGALRADLRGTFVHREGADTNPYTAEGVIDAVRRARAVGGDTFVFGNFVDTDSLWGHTRDVSGSLASLMMIDRILPLIEAELGAGDLLLITADHGMEHRPDTPAGAGYGYHRREPVPLLAKRVGHGADLDGLSLGAAAGLTQVGDLVAQLFGCQREFRDLVHVIPA
jgi:phosphopentomutase